MNELLRDELEILRRRLRRTQFALGVLAAIGGATIVIAATGPSQIIRAKGIVITDDAGRDRILLGAPVPVSANRQRKDARTASLAFIDSQGHDRVIVGESPAPYVNGRSGKRIADAQGLVFYDPNGSERGGIGFLSSGRAVVALDYPTRDAVGMMTDDKSGFAGLLVAHRPPNDSAAILMGVKQGMPAITLSDPTGVERAKLNVAGNAAPAWEMTAAKR